MMNASPWRLTHADGGLQRGKRQPGVDRFTDGIADDAARPGIEDHRHIDEADGDGDIGDIGHPQPVRPVDNQVLGQIGKDRLVMVAVGGGDESPAALRLQIMLAHDTADFLGVDDDPLMPQLGTDPPIAVAFELLADRRDPRDDGGVGLLCRGVVEGGAWQTHQTASFADGEATGPVMTDVVALLVRSAFLDAPFRNSTDQALQGSDLRLIFLQQVGSSRILVEGAGLVLRDPDADQIARDVVALGDTMERLPGNELLRHLPLALDAVTPVLGHRPSSSEGPAYPVSSPPSICPEEGAHSTPAPLIVALCRFPVGAE